MPSRGKTCNTEYVQVFVVSAWCLTTSSFDCQSNIRESQWLQKKDMALSATMAGWSFAVLISQMLLRWDGFNQYSLWPRQWKPGHRMVRYSAKNDDRGQSNCPGSVMSATRPWWRRSPGCTCAGGDELIVCSTGISGGNCIDRTLTGAYPVSCSVRHSVTECHRQFLPISTGMAGQSDHTYILCTISQWCQACWKLWMKTERG